MEEFLNIDEITVFRQENLFDDMDEVARIYERGLAQLGKDYDFNFDVNTLDKIVCSELVYHAYGKISWPVKYVLGRPTISPDNLVEVAYYRNAPISYHFGERALERKKVNDVDKDDIAEKIGLIKLDHGGYAKAKRRCRDVHQESGNIQRVCYGTMDVLTYKASNESIYDLPGTAEAF
jgi:hypothetical protein